MIIDRIKISQEVNFLGMPTWIGMEASLLPDENEKEGLKALQKSITEYLQEENKPPKSKWQVTDSEYGATKPLIEELEACTTYADIQSYRFTVKNADEQATYIRKLEELSPKNQ